MNFGQVHQSLTMVAIKLHYCFIFRFKENYFWLLNVRYNVYFRLSK